MNLTNNVLESDQRQSEYSNDVNRGNKYIGRRKFLSYFTAMAGFGLAHAKGKTKNSGHSNLLKKKNLPKQTHKPKHQPKPKEKSLVEIINEQMTRERENNEILRDTKTSWIVYDRFNNHLEASINGNIGRQAASMVKPFIALAYLHSIQHGNLAYDNLARFHMEKMISESDNWSTNWVMQKIGGPNSVQKILQDYYGNIFKKVQIKDYEPLDLKERIKTGILKFDNVPSGTDFYANTAAANDYRRFLEAIMNKEVYGWQEIKRLMSMPKKDRIITGTNNIPEGTIVWDKTGTHGRVCGNFGYVEAMGEDGGTKPYTFIGIIEKPIRVEDQDYNIWKDVCESAMRRISDKVYLFMQKKNNLKLKTA